MKNSFALKIILITLLVIIAVTLIYFAFLEIMPGLIPLIREGDEAAVEAYLRANDSFTGMLCTVLLQMFIVFSVVISSVPVQIAAGLVYGTLRGFLLCHLSATAAHAVVFLIARRLNHGLDRLMPKADPDKPSRLDFLLRSDSPAYMTILAYLVPVLPNGIIPYVAAQTKITFFQFLRGVFLGSLLPVLILCAMGREILAGNYLMTALLALGLFLLVGILWLLKDRILLALDRRRRRRAILRGEEETTSPEDEDNA